MASMENRLSYEKFYTACESMKKHKQWFLDKRPNESEACKKLSELVGFTVAHSSLSKIRYESGVLWVARRTREGSAFNSYTACRLLATAVRQLYEKLGEPLPLGVQSLVDIFEAARSKDGNTNDK